MDAGWWQVDYKGVGGIAESGGVVNVDSDRSSRSTLDINLLNLKSFT